VIAKIAGGAVGMGAAAIAMLLLFGLWYAFPLIARWRGGGRVQYRGSPAE